MAQPFRATLKERKRYVVYQPADDNTVLESLKELFGTHGAASAGILPIEETNNKSILRVSHTDVDKLKAALVWSNKESITTTGTLKKARAVL